MDIKGKGERNEKRAPIKSGVVSQDEKEKKQKNIYILADFLRGKIACLISIAKHLPIVASKRPLYWKGGNTDKKNIHADPPSSSEKSFLSKSVPGGKVTLGALHYALNKESKGEKLKK